MTSGYLFVDGYNATNAWPKLRELGNLERNLEAEECVGRKLPDITSMLHVQHLL